MDKNRTVDYPMESEEVDEFVAAIEKAEIAWEKDKRRRQKEKNK